MARLTDAQTETWRQGDRETGRQADMETQRHRDTETQRHRFRDKIQTQTQRHRHRDTDTETDTERQRDRVRDREQERKGVIEIIMLCIPHHWPTLSRMAWQGDAWEFDTRSLMDVVLTVLESPSVNQYGEVSTPHQCGDLVRLLDGGAILAQSAMRSQAEMGVKMVCCPPWAASQMKHLR